MEVLYRMFGCFKVPYIGRSKALKLDGPLFQLTNHTPPHPRRNKALLRAYLPLVSLDKAL